MDKVHHNFYIIRNDKDHNDIYVQHEICATGRAIKYAFFRWRDPRLHDVKKTSFEHVPNTEMYLMTWKYIIDKPLGKRCLAAFQIYNGLF